MSIQAIVYITNMLEPIIERNHLCENQDTFFHPHTECNYEILIQAPKGVGTL
jgi:hypothetical protein